jgi:hypothetical protein
MADRITPETVAAAITNIVDEGRRERRKERKAMTDISYGIPRHIQGGRHGPVQEIETRVLNALAELGAEVDRGSCATLSDISACSGIPVDYVRPALGRLRGRALVHYGTAIRADGTDFAGSGYAITEDGCFALADSEANLATTRVENS